jgi:hypothetical protein
MKKPQNRGFANPDKSFADSAKIADFATNRFIFFADFETVLQILQIRFCRI